MSNILIIAGRRVIEVFEYKDKKQAESRLEELQKEHYCALALVPENFLKKDHEIQFPWYDEYLNREYYCSCEK